MDSTQTIAIAPVPRETQIAWLTLEELHAPPVKAGAAYWLSLCGERRFPARSDLVPRRIAKLMPNMSLLKVIDGGADLEHRVVGDALVRAFRVPVQNRCFSEIGAEAPEFLSRCLPLFRQVVVTGEPVAWRSTSGHDAPNVLFTSSEVVLLPLGSNGMVDHVLGFGFYDTAAHDGCSTRAAGSPQNLTLP